MKSTTTLFTVVYPGCEPFLPRFFQSINDQDIHDFRLMILNDGLSKLERFTTGLRDRLDIFDVEGTIADVRRQGVQLLMDSKYEKIVFADSDDTISTNRIRLASKALENYDIVINDLTTVTDDDEILKEHYLSERITNNSIIKPDFIVDKNVIGLGNTAVRCSQLRDLIIPSDTIAVDWVIFTDMLLRGASAIFKNDSVCHYRQHRSNTAGLKNVSIEKIHRGLTVQVQNASFFADQSVIHQQRLEKLMRLKSFFLENGHNLQHYKQSVEKRLPDYPLWWEEIYTLDQLSL